MDLSFEYLTHNYAMESDEVALDKLLLKIQYMEESANLICQARELDWAYHDGSTDKMLEFYESAQEESNGKIVQAAQAAWKKLKEMFEKIKDFFVETPKIKSDDIYVGDPGTTKALRGFNQSCGAVRPFLHKLKTFIGDHKIILAFLAAGTLLLNHFRRIKKIASSGEISRNNLSMQKKDGEILSTDDLIKAQGGIEKLSSELAKIVDQPDLEKKNLPTVRKIQSILASLAFATPVDRKAFRNVAFDTNGTLKDKADIDMKKFASTQMLNISNARQLLKPIDDNRLNEIAKMIRKKSHNLDKTGKSAKQNAKLFEDLLNTAEKEKYQARGQKSRNDNIAIILDGLKSGAIEMNTLTHLLGIPFQKKDEPQTKKKQKKR